VADVAGDYDGLMGGRDRADKEIRIGETPPLSLQKGLGLAKDPDRSEIQT
jgi:hypothetical protein